MNEVGAISREMADAPDLFRAAIEYTARQTGFRRELVEKDFHCSVLLDHLNRYLPETAVFKGGTCISKIYADFYRLSEDLDYTIPVPLEASRTERRRLITPIKTACEELASRLPGILQIEPLRGANLSMQYVGTWGYPSAVTGATERVKIEFGLREPGLLPAEVRPAGTLLLDPITGARKALPFRVRAMALPEIWAEKVRAALTRREPAIRDFFDLDHARTKMGLNFASPDLRELVKRKLAVPGNDPVDVSPERKSELARQVEGQLRTVLRATDFDRFNLDRIWEPLAVLAEQLEEERRSPA
jgi:predicted nucleotidyltransferase component of viral defense system